MTALYVIGGIAFGIVVGWLTYFVLRRAQPKALSDLSTIIGILGGATIVGLFSPTEPAFGGYAIGLFLGFFGYYIIYILIVGRKAIKDSLLAELKEGHLTLMEAGEKTDKGSAPQ